MWKNNLLATEYDLVVLVGGTAFACLQIETKMKFQFCSQLATLNATKGL